MVNMAKGEHITIDSEFVLAALLAEGERIVTIPMLKQFKRSIHDAFPNENIFVDISSVYAAVQNNPWMFQSVGYYQIAKTPQGSPEETFDIKYVREVIGVSIPPRIKNRILTDLVNQTINQVGKQI